MKSPNLMLHCGASLVDRSEIGQVEMPEATKSYTPIPHNVIVELAQKQLSEIGFDFGVEAHAMTNNGNRYFGLVQLLDGSEKEDDDYATVMGLRNSHDKSFPGAAAFGDSPFVCENLCFSGEVKFSRRHTTHIMRDLPDLIALAINQTRLMKDNCAARYAHYKASKLTKMRADHTIIEMVRNGALNTTRVGRIVKEWDNPSHDFGGRTAWRLLNAATQALKGTKLHDMPPRTIRLQGLLDKVTGFVPAKMITAADWEG